MQNKLVDTILYNKAFTVLEIKNNIAKIELAKNNKIVYRDIKQDKTKSKDKYFNLLGSKQYLKFLFKV